MILIKLLLAISILTALSGCTSKTKTEKVCSSDGYLYEVSLDTKRILRVKDEFKKCKGWEIF